MGRLANKNILITGGNSGIGLAAAQEFEREGARVAICGFAGLGDMAVGLTAPWIALALVRRPGFAASRGFVIWNLLGILDLVAAVGIAALLATQATGAVREASVTQMARLPLLLVPAYLVPVFIMLHLSALLQARRLARTTRGKEAGPNTSLRA